MASRITDLRAGTIEVGGAPHLVGVIVDGSGTPITATGSGGAVTAYTSRLTDLRATTVTIGTEPYIGLAVVDASGNQITAFGGSPGGSSGQVQFNSSSTFAGDANFTWDATTGLALGKKLTITGGTVTDPTIPISLTQTWNDAADTFDAVDINITSTASASASRLIRCRVGGAERFSVDKSGHVHSISSVRSLTTGTGEFAINFYNNGLTMGAIGLISWGSAGASTPDLAILRDAANTFAQRNSTNAQTTRGYRTYTDGSNHERWALQTGAGYVELAAETAGSGTDDLNVKLTPAGAGVVQFGTHTGLASETVTGYITIKDAAGNTRKLAVVS